MGATAAATPTRVRVDLLLGEETIARYEEEARRRALKFDRLISLKLFEFANYEGTRPLHFNDQERSELEALIGRNLKDASDAIRQIQRGLSIKVGDIVVPLRPELLERLRTRNFHQTLEDFIVETVNRLLEQYVGLR